MSPRHLRALGLAFSLAAMQCTAIAADARDPWESMNRRVYAFNDVVDVDADQFSIM